MSSPDSKPNAADAGRVRSSRACLHCSRRKVKCDGLQPCNNCSKDSTFCEYGAQKKRGPPKGCDPRGGRKKKATDSSTGSKPSSSSSTTIKRPVSPPPTGVDPALRTLQSARSHSSEFAERSSQLYGAERPVGRTDVSRSPLTPSKMDLYASAERPLNQPSQSSMTTSLPSRVASDERPLPTSYPHRDPFASWSRSSYDSPSTSSPSYARPSPHRHENTSSASASHEQHYLQPQHQHQHQPSSQHHHSDPHHSERSWPSFSANTRHSQHQTASKPHSYDAYPLQGPLRDQSRTSPLPSPHAMPPPLTSSADLAAHSTADRPANGLPSARSNAGFSSSTYASPRTHPSRGLHEGPTTHYQSATAAYDRNSSLPSLTSNLTRRLPVSASRLTENSTTSAAPWPSSTSTSQTTALESSPAFNGASHTNSPSTTAAPHRPWYNGSQPPSPLGPASVPRSQVSSPGAHWFDHHARFSPAGADHSHSSSKVHLEDRLPPHIIQRLLDIYLTFVHPHWPIIYLPSIASLHSLRQTRPIVFEAILAVASNTFDAYTDSSSPDDQQSSNPVLEMLYAESPQSTEPAYKSNELRDHFLHRVKARIFEGKFTQDIGTIQAAVLVSVIELGCGHPSSAFQFGGIACRMALDMNLHRCTAQSSSSSNSFAGQRDSSRHDHPSDDHSNGRAESHRSAAQLQEKLRVFWACYIVDKILSTALDKPAQLRSAEIEADWPSVREADEYDLWLNETTRKFVDKSQLPYLEGVKVHALSSFKAWAEVMAILERILEEVYSPQAKRDRRRTKGVSDYEALLRLNDRLTKWRADLPPHLKWSGTWTSPELLPLASTRRSTAERKECDPHRGFPPQILTMRSWYCICLILLHRPRVPKLLHRSRARSATASSDELGSAGALGDRKSLAARKEQKNGSQAGTNGNGQELAGLDICNAAAKEVCDILHVYGSSFRIRKISSSWVYLIFQTATIHAALAASKSVVVFKARQSSIWGRRGSHISQNELSSSGADGGALAENAELQAAGGDPEAHRVTEAELEGSSELVKSSALYLAECVRYLKRIGPTWQSASHHVAVLRNLCIASAQARPMSPSTPDGEMNGKEMGPSSAYVKSEDQGNGAGLPRVTDPATGNSHQPHEAAQHDAGMPPSSSEIGNAQQRFPPANRPDQQTYQDPARGFHPPAPTGLGLSASNGLQTHYLQPEGYSATNPQDQLPAVPGMPVDQQQQQQLIQQTMYAINANDSAFWASMPVASEGYNEWDEFFKTFNPGAGADFASRQVNYHPTAALDLITALQDPNRLLSGLQ